MGRYIAWSDVIARYPALSTYGAVASLSIPYAEAAIDASLTQFFTTPFSDNNLTVKDLVIDDVYYRAGRFKFEDAAGVHSGYLSSVKMLVKGKIGMVTNSGDVVSVRQAQGIYSSTQSYHPAFGVRPTIEQHIDPTNIEAERDLD